MFLKFSQSNMRAEVSLGFCFGWPPWQPWRPKIANTHQHEPNWAKNKLIARRGQDQGNTTRLTLVSPKAAGAPVSRVTLHCSNWATARAVAETSPSVLLDFLARVLSSGYLGKRPTLTQSALTGSIEWRRSDPHRPGDADSPTIARN